MNNISSMKKERESNFELLRIIVMFGIILFHYSDHGCNDISYDNALAINNAFECFCRIGGGLGNCVFMIMTGYFMSKSQFRIEKALKIWGQVFFYSALSYIVACSFEVTYLSKKDLVEALLPITSNQYWYFTAYMIIFFLSPVMNCAVEKLEKKQLCLLLVALFWFFSVIPTIGYAYTISGDRVGVMIFLYFIGAYIRKYYSIKTKMGFKIELVLTFFAIVLLSVFSIFWEKSSYLQFLTSDRFGLIWGIEKAPIIICSVLFFLVFKNINIRSNKVINWIAASVFGVYLLHMNNWTTGVIWNDFCKTKEYYKASNMIPHVLLCTLLIFIICTVIDKIREYVIERPLVNAIKNIHVTKSRIIIGCMCIVIGLLSVYVRGLRLVTTYGSSLSYNDSMSIIQMDEQVEVAEEFYCSDNTEIRRILFHTITWNNSFSEDQVLTVSIVDDAQNNVFIQQIPLNHFVDQGDYEIKIPRGVKLNRKEKYTLKFSSNTSAGQQIMALMLTNISNNSEGKCILNGSDIIGHISANISGFDR